MPLKKAPHWTGLYYNVIEHYFWRPQDIGRKSDPDRRSRPWGFWKQKLSSQETPLNHMLDLFFHMIPPDLVDVAVSAVAGRTISGLDLVEPTPGTLDDNVVQPDIILKNDSELVFVEMKVDSRSSVDQFVKYAIAALILIREDPTISSVDLVVLSRHDDHQSVWRGARSLGISSTQDLRGVALRGLQGDSAVWKERAVPRYVAGHPNDVSELSRMCESMTLTLSRYDALAEALRSYAASEDTVERLVAGILAEFDRRSLLVGTA